MVTLVSKFGEGYIDIKLIRQSDNGLRVGGFLGDSTSDLYENLPACLIRFSRHNNGVLIRFGDHSQRKETVSNSNIIIIYLGKSIQNTYISVYTESGRHTYTQGHIHPIRSFICARYKT